MTFFSCALLSNLSVMLEFDLNASLKSPMCCDVAFLVAPLPHGYYQQSRDELSLMTSSHASLCPCREGHLPTNLLNLWLLLQHRIMTSRLHKCML